MERNTLNIAAFIPVRLSSSRLPRKHLRRIGDRPLLSWVITRLRNVRRIDRIVICTPDEPENRDLAGFAAGENVELFVFPGDVNDVVGRLTQAARHYDANICILASGDCPLIDSDTVARQIEPLCRDPELDHVTLASHNGRRPTHEGILVMRRWVWERAEQLSDSPPLREHQFPVIGLRPERFADMNTATIPVDDIYYRLVHRISVDTPADLAFMNALHDRLTERGLPFDLPHAWRLLAEQPALLTINQAVRQKGLFDTSTRILFLVSGAGPYGFGNLTRALEIGRQLVNHFGAGVRFKVSDPSGRSFIEQHGFEAMEDRSLSITTQDRDGFDVFVFDVNRHFPLPQDDLQAVKDRHKTITIIDHLGAGTELADRLIIPTAHYSGPHRPQLITGAPYVVLRSAVIDVKTRKLPKEKRALVYCSHETDLQHAQAALAMLRETRPDIDIEPFTGAHDEFAEELARSEVVVTPLGVTAYEALYLGTAPLIIARPDDPEEDLANFHRFAGHRRVRLDPYGALRIAALIAGRPLPESKPRPESRATAVTPPVDE